jgi:hypothetical protein
VGKLRKEKQFDLNDLTLIDSVRVEIDTEGEGSMGNWTRCECAARVCHRVCYDALYCVSAKKKCVKRVRLLTGVGIGEVRAHHYDWLEHVLNSGQAA